MLLAESYKLVFFFAFKWGKALNYARNTFCREMNDLYLLVINIIISYLIQCLGSFCGNVRLRTIVK